jgi:hypothetical protein
VALSAKSRENSKKIGHIWWSKAVFLVTIGVSIGKNGPNQAEIGP